MEKTITAKRLRELREKKGVSQACVADYLGLDRSAYTAYESGKSRPVRYMNQLSEYFDVSIDYLLGISDIPQPKKQNLNEEEKWLITNYWELNEEGKKMFVAYLAFLLSQNQYKKKESSAS